MAFRCVCVIRGNNTPLLVDLTSRSDDAFGVVVPMPAAPVEGKVFCAVDVIANKMIIIVANSRVLRIFFMIKSFLQNYGRRYRSFNHTFVGCGKMKKQHYPMLLLQIIFRPYLFLNNHPDEKSP